MWSLYGDSHKGVCLEFERLTERFYDVKYVKQRPKLDIMLLTQENINIHVKKSQNLYSYKLLNNVRSLFIKKSAEWKYEEEARYIAFADDVINPNLNTPNTEKIGDDYFLNLKVKRIFVGIKAHGEKLEQLIKLASEKNIPIVYMKEDKTEYLIVEDKDTNNYKEKENKVKL